MPGSAGDAAILASPGSLKLKTDKCPICGAKLQFYGFQMLKRKRFKRFYSCAICGHRLERIHKHKLPEGTI